MKQIHLARAVAGAALAASLAGCSTMSNLSVDSLNPWSGPTERTRTVPADATVYACADAKRLVVRTLAGSSSVMIVFREREFRLDQAPATPGRYTNGSSTLVFQGDEVSLEEDGTRTYSNCRKTAA